MRTRCLLGGGLQLEGRRAKWRTMTKNHRPDARPTVVIHWPRITECSPAKFAEVVSTACRLLSNASTELAHRKIVPERS
jgi:hypothetical protein